ncbi:putative D-isomer specific 2-hydroxyacid dehydrogenase NAD-binding protein [Monocercomonoides exilis]|uniref:putative D-isomer specific 2-hydroxyacid dehydrogenase NAD-binding protein n=1 Tax=Monocercomonoides exilis TaxID=2049356 RepID=UPI00355A16E1|nr:putative D-isomer specific 2-hydroxyacid dehydrogenase NAD-binding protein [Monocercomonoides exilis]|eukprot:MONOS_482.1-p1 / transcript=MONOS_482.1 / gene=MONOS_482 / organism=Monocercomonoides_exilis_PA203 / gene_product=D-isomer specific 2-hydroxyacid dehydrogenase NAD-binding protein / transcript_product=D-isomer specific 2-hydroxyacid dehydrogenase NAD-binding protein / location=Mono_scaffold00007:266425-267729(-) / protein_length=400 / sequence_SO=supercontig / SO=protein_coding / is_pseudo=false
MVKFHFYICSISPCLRPTLEKCLKEVEFPFETEIVYHHRLQTPEDQIREELKKADVVIAEPHIAHLLSNPQESCPKLRWFQSTFAGVDHFMNMKPCPYAPDLVPLPFALTRGAALFGPGMAEYAISMMIAVQRNFFTLKEAQMKKESPYSIRECATTFPLLSQLTVGILGASGSIGQDTARRLYVLGCNVWGLCRRHRKEGEPLVTPQVESPLNARLPPADQCFQKLVALEDDDEKQSLLRSFLSGVDVVINILPSTPDTNYLLGGRIDKDGKPIPSPLEACKPHCVFINIGRGSIISEAAMVDVLKRKCIRHAVLDVFEKEPLPATSPLITELSTDMITFTPHTSGLPQHDNYMEHLLSKNLQLFKEGMIFEQSEEAKAKGEKWAPKMIYQMDFKEGY